MEDSSDMLRLGMGFTYRPADIVNLAWNPSYVKRNDAMQYITTRSASGQTRYVFGSMNQEVFSFSFRLNITIMPDLSLQYWGQPFVATGQFANFKYVTDPMARQFTDRFNLLSEDQIQLTEGVYYVDENRNGITDYQFNKPDFRFKEFLSNLVIRWEYNPGSSIHLVWSQQRSGADSNGNLHVVDDLGDLFSEKPHHVFLLKFTYRIGVR